MKTKNKRGGRGFVFEIDEKPTFLDEMKTKDACFVCTSPYQIIGAIGIVKSKNLCADLYTDPAIFKLDDSLLRKLREYAVFSDIIVMDNLGQRNKRDFLSRKLRSIELTIFPEKTLSAYLPPDISYNEFYASARSSTKAAQLAVLRKRNPNIKWIVFEDGLGSYSENGRVTKVSGLRRLIEGILGWDLNDPKKMSVMVYCPELISNYEHLKGISIEQMPRIELNDENRALLSDIFSIKEEHYINERYIIFDTRRNGGVYDYLTQAEKDCLDNCYEAIREFADEDVLLKEHPKSKEKTACSLKTYPYQGLPMEVLYLNMKDLENRVLISQVSTAVFSPKMLFDCEPYVICLHHLLRENGLSVDFEGIFEKFRSTYRDPSRVVAPNSIDELKQILHNIR